jgi:alpha,alpha-trehalase
VYDFPAMSDSTFNLFCVLLNRQRRVLSRTAVIVCLLVTSVWAQTAPQSSTVTAGSGLAPIRNYISNGWDVLTRSMARCDSVADPKLAAPSVLYLPAELAVPPAVQKLQTDCKVDVKHLPIAIRRPGEIDVTNIQPHGLLYLENSYVVPGGRFNEMYGWDSYFIIVGLLRDGRIDLARGMVENFFFEIAHYGTVLNANRTYYLTRSQPPFLTTMIMDVYQAQKTSGHEDPGWLEKAYGYASRDYENWNRAPHLAGSTGLSRYYDFGEGPPPEGLQDEAGYYHRVVSYYLAHPDAATNHLIELKQPNSDTVGFTFALQLCENTQAGSKCDPLKSLALSRDFYKGDRSMRESGFDVSFRFGPFSADTHHYAPICLNSLLYKTEKDLEQMSQILGKKADSEKWRKLAEHRKQRINQYLWDSQRGLFFDYNFENQSRSSYEFITTFYPLWAGLATPEQAKAVVQNLSIFEQPGGLAMSRHESEGQWDYPYGWAPTQLLAVKGLRRYGYNADADRISYNFLSMIAENFRRDATIREKYNVVTRSSETHVGAGYRANVVGFGWTNAAFLEFLHDLPKEQVDRLEKEQGQAK